MSWTSSTYDHFIIWPSNVTFTFNLPKQMANDTSTPQKEHLCQIIFKFMHKCISYGLDKVNLWPFYQSTLTCDLDLQPIWTNVLNGISTRQGEQLCQVILKSMHKCTSYDPDKSGRTHVCPTHARATYIHRAEVVRTMSRLPQAGSTKISGITYATCEKSTLHCLYEIHFEKKKFTIKRPIQGVPVQACPGRCSGERTESVSARSPERRGRRTHNVPAHSFPDDGGDAWK